MLYNAVFCHYVNNYKRKRAVVMDADTDMNDVGVDYNALVDAEKERLLTYFNQAMRLQLVKAGLQDENAATPPRKVRAEFLDAAERKFSVLVGVDGQVRMQTGMSKIYLTPQADSKGYEFGKTENIEDKTLLSVLRGVNWQVRKDGLPFEVVPPTKDEIAMEEEQTKLLGYLRDGLWKKLSKDGFLGEDGSLPRKLASKFSGNDGIAIYMDVHSDRTVSVSREGKSAVFKPQEDGQYAAQRPEQYISLGKYLDILRNVNTCVEQDALSFRVAKGQQEIKANAAVSVGDVANLSSLALGHGNKDTYQMREAAQQAVAGILFAKGIEI